MSRDTVKKKGLIKLKEIRKAKGLTLNELAEHLNINYQAIGRYERGDTKPNLDTLENIASALGVQLTDILDSTSVDTLQEKIDTNSNSTQIKLTLLPNIYSKLEELCEKNSLDIGSTDKVELATIFFQMIQDIYTNPQDEIHILKSVFLGFDAIFEKLYLSK